MPNSIRGAGVGGSRFLAGAMLLLGCNRSPLAEEEKLAAKVFDALSEGRLDGYERVVTNQYTLLAKLQSPNRFAAKDTFAGSTLAPEERQRLIADFKRAAAGEDGNISFQSERFKALQFVEDLPDTPLAEYGELDIVPKKYAFVTDGSEKHGTVRPPFIVLGKVRDFVHVFGLILPEKSELPDDEADEVADEEEAVVEDAEAPESIPTEMPTEIPTGESSEENEALP